MEMQNMSRDSAFAFMYDQYLPFRLYADHKLGADPAELAATFSLPVRWVEERLEAMRLCIEKQVHLDCLLR
jgi:hypothetical protein